jgi:cbb3-type cytochrome c oxidase subunit III
VILGVALVASLAWADAAPAKPKPARSGQAIFAATCAKCHGADGRAQSDFGKQHSIPDFTSKEWMAKHPEADLLATVTDGQLEAEMPAFRGELSADEIKAVVAYVQKLPAAGKK